MSRATIQEEGYLVASLVIPAATTEMIPAEAATMTEMIPAEAMYERGLWLSRAVS